MQVIENATLEPMHRFSGKFGRFFTRYGLRDGDGRAVRDWPLMISMKNTFPFQSISRAPKIEHEIREPVIYAGAVYGWFGHFLTEGVPNFLAVAKAKQVYPKPRILAHTHGIFDAKDWRESSASAGMLYFLDRIGLDINEIDFVLQPTRCAALIVPDAPFTGKARYKPWVAEAIDAVWPAPETTKPVFLSRSKLELPPRIENEQAIEDIFAAKGFEITHLQEHSLDEQMAIIRAANHIAGPQGSALHWSLYSQVCESVVSLGYPSLLQKGICHVRGQKYFEIRGRRSSLSSYHRLRKIDEDVVLSTLDRL